ncbi:MAG: tetratricopeptide repeat protein [Nitrospiraceae bacterium]|nr:MAG: tetratricopeptide repeat protein [Nitrospiraceae bacterium]
MVYRIYKLLNGDTTDLSNMIKKLSIYFYIVVVITVFIPPSSSAAEDISDHVDRGNRYLINNQPFMAVKEFRQAIAKGSDDPVLFRNLSVVLYDLGFIDEAITEMEKALALTQNSNFLRRELGIMYLSRNKYTIALEQFVAILKSNPGFSEAYYYLGEIYYKTKQYDMAWLAANMALRLGHTGNDLADRLSAKSEAPKQMPWSNPGEEIYIRQIRVDLRRDADEIAARLQRGDLFENIAGEFDETIDADLGGYRGSLSPNELHPLITRALTEREPLSEAVIIQTEKGYHIVQRLIPFSEESWKDLLAGKTRPKTVAVSKLLRLPPSSVTTAEAPPDTSSKEDEKIPSAVQTEKKPSLIVRKPVSPTIEKLRQAPQQTASIPEEDPEKTVAPEPDLKTVDKAVTDSGGSTYRHYAEKKEDDYELKGKLKEPEIIPDEDKVTLPKPDKQKMYYIHVGTFRDRKNADLLLNDLKKLGYRPYSYIMETKRGDFHKVVAAEYTSLSEAKKTGEELKKKSIDYYITSKK